MPIRYRSKRLPEFVSIVHLLVEIMKLMVRSHALAASRVLVLLIAAVAGSQAQSLPELESRLLQSNPAISSARRIERHAEASSDGAAAWDPPTVGIQFSMLPPADPNPSSKGETMVMLEQMIPLGSQRSSMARAMRAEADVGRAQVDGTARALISELHGAYYLLWFVDRRIEITRLSRELASEFRQAVQTRYEVGKAGESDLLSVTSELEATDLEESDLRRWRAEVEARINALLLRPADEGITVVNPPPQTPLPPFDSVRVLVVAHPDVQRMEAMAAMDDLAAEARHAMLAPMLMVRGGLSWMPDGHPVREAMLAGATSSHGGGVTRFGLTIGASLSIPVAPWSRTGPEGQAEALRVQAERTRDEKTDMQSRMISMLRSQYLRAERAAAGLRYATNTSLPLLEQRLDAARQDYAGGRVSFLSLLDGYRTLIAAHVDLAQRRLDYAQALAEIASITGVRL